MGLSCLPVVKLAILGVIIMKVLCEECGEDTPHYDMTNYGSIKGGYRQLCNRCFSAEVANVSGVGDFDNTRLQPIWIADCTGEKHQFHFVSRLLGNMITLDAFEVENGDQAGYQFQIIGNPAEDLFTMLGRMVGKIRKALSVKHIKDEGDRYGLQISDMIVRGRFECDLSDDDRMPCVIVDGQEISWTAFGRMISSYEGWQFKLEIVDRSDDV